MYIDNILKDCKGLPDPKRIFLDFIIRPSEILHHQLETLLRDQCVQQDLSSAHLLLAFSL